MNPQICADTVEVRDQPAAWGAVFALSLGAFALVASEFMPVSLLTPIAAEVRKLLADPAEIDAILKKGARRAAERAAPIMAETRRLVGFVT